MKKRTRQRNSISFFLVGQHSAAPKDTLPIPRTAIQCLYNLDFTVWWIAFTKQEITPHWFTSTHQHCALKNSSGTIPYITELYHFNIRLYLTEPVRHQTSQYPTLARQSAQFLDHTLLNCPVTIPIHNDPIQHDAFTYLRLTIPLPLPYDNKLYQYFTARTPTVPTQ